MPADFNSSPVMQSCSDRKSATLPSTLALPMISPDSTRTKRAVKRTFCATF